MQFIIENSIAMRRLGGRIAKACSLGNVIYLTGELGVGKTTWVRGFLRTLGYLKPVRSPTFNLFEIYQTQDRMVCHFDLYRLVRPEELIYIGIEDYFTQATICLVEWPEHGGKFLPPADLICNFDFGKGDYARRAKVAAVSHQGNAIIENFEKK